jgi:hypothetical protein
MHVQGRATALFATAFTGLRSRSFQLGRRLEAVAGAVRPGLKRLSDVSVPRALSATLGRGLRRRHRARRVVETWWASHTLETVLWTLALALGIGVGLVIARL